MRLLIAIAILSFSCSSRQITNGLYSSDIYFIRVKEDNKAIAHLPSGWLVGFYKIKKGEIYFDNKENYQAVYQFESLNKQSFNLRRGNEVLVFNKIKF